MSVRVLNPVVLTELCKIRHSPSPSRNSSSHGRNLDRIKRDLFGPVNPVETTKIFNEELERHQDKAIKKWGFDFRSGSPLSNATNNQFVWERVSFNDFVPEIYTLSRAAHVRQTDEQPHEANNYDILMDERAERANIINLSAISTSSIGETDDSCDDCHDESMAFKVPAATIVSAATIVRAATVKTITNTTLLSCGKSLRKRQPKITEYMKERKRLAQAPKKSSPVKRMRTSTSSSSVASGCSTFFPLQKNR